MDHRCSLRYRLFYCFSSKNLPLHVLPSVYIMESEKKKKSQNFSASDRALLLKIANNMLSIIECKKTDAVTWRQKEEAWKKIANKYNASTSSSHRTDKQLKNKYEAIKKELKKQHSQYMSYQRGTGGGPYVKPPSPKTEKEKILANTISLSIEGLAVPYDSDAVAGISATSGNEMVICSDIEISSEIDVDWSNSNCALFQTPKHPVLRPMLEAIDLNSILEDNDPVTVESTVQNRVDYTEPTPEEHNYNKPVIRPQVSTWQSRRRPILSKKKCISSAGGKFEELAQKKSKLVDIQKEIAIQQLKQEQLEHEKKLNY